MNWRTFWQAVDRFGERGAPRCEWRWALGDEFGSFEPLLKAGRTLAESIHDPDDSTQAMNTFEEDNGCFEAHSTEIPPHRAPLLLPRSELVMLTLNVPGVAASLASEIGLVPGEFRSRGPAGLHEMGVISLANQAPQPVFLLLPGRSPRALQIVEALTALREAVLLLPGSSAQDEAVHRLAAEHSVTVRSLELEPTRVLAAIKPGASGGIKPVLLPRPGWTWTMLDLDFSVERFVATIDGQRFEGRWVQHGVRVLHNGQLTDFIELLVRIARRERLEQSRHAPACRKQVSRFRETLRRLFPLEGEPMHNGIAAFRVSSKVARPARSSIA